MADIAAYVTGAISIVFIDVLCLFLDAASQIRTVLDGTFVPVLFAVAAPCILVIVVNMMRGDNIDISIGFVVCSLICCRIAAIIVFRRGTLSISWSEFEGVIYSGIIALCLQRGVLFQRCIRLGGDTITVPVSLISRSGDT